MPRDRQPQYDDARRRQIRWLRRFMNLAELYTAEDFASAYGIKPRNVQRRLMPPDRGGAKTPYDRDAAVYAKALGIRLEEWLDPPEMETTEQDRRMLRAWEVLAGTPRQAERRKLEEGLVRGQASIPRPPTPLRRPRSRQRPDRQGD